jgi:Na+/H+ antiporter NhaD/arsenite permease-like protein
MRCAAKLVFPLIVFLFSISLPVLASDGLAISATRDPVSQALVAILIVGVFCLLAMEKAHRVLVILAAVALMWLVTYLTPYHLIPFDTAKEAIDLNVIVLLAAMMAVVGVLKTTGVFSWAVARLL